jgi:drug/metabolite transporter (DMT)-like permease
LFLVASLFSPSFLFMKVGLTGFPPLTLATLRVAIAAMMMWGFLRVTGHCFPHTWAVWRKLFVVGLFGNALPFAMFCLGETRADSGSAAILNATTPIFTVLLAHVYIADERIRAGRAAGVAIGFLGVLCLFLPQIEGGFLRGGTSWGYGAFLAAAMCYGFASVYTRKHLRDVPARITSGAQLICATVLLFPMAMLVERPFHLRPGAAAIGSVLALSILGTAVAFTLMFSLLRKTSATFVSMVTYIIPPAGIALGAVFLDEHVGWNALAGCALILMGVMGVNGLWGRMARGTWALLVMRRGRAAGTP